MQQTTSKVSDIVSGARWAKWLGIVKMVAGVFLLWVMASVDFPIGEFTALDAVLEIAFGAVSVNLGLKLLNPEKRRSTQFWTLIIIYGIALVLHFIAWTSTAATGTRPTGQIIPILTAWALWTFIKGRRELKKIESFSLAQSGNPIHTEKSDSQEIKFYCSNCGTKYTADLTQSGKEGKCKNCGSSIKVPLQKDGSDFKTPEWYKLLDSDSRPPSAKIRRLEEIRLQYQISHEHFAIFVLGSPATIRKTQYSILQDLKARHPNASDKELWTMVLMTRSLAFTSRGANGISEYEIARVVSNASDFEDIRDYILLLDSKERPPDPTGLEKAIINAIEN